MFKRLPADEVLPFWADADHTILDAAVHVYAVEEYDESEIPKAVIKVEVLQGGGVDCVIRHDDGTLEPDSSARSGDYITAPDPKTGEQRGYNWKRIPLICFKSSHHEIPLLSKVKCLQDAYNQILSAFADRMEEDIHNTVIVIKNYDGEDLGRLRRNLATYGIIKVRSYEGSECFADAAGRSVSYTFNQTEAAVKRELAAAPDGARYGIYIKWKGRPPAAHVFIAEKSGGVVHYMDPQTGNMDASGYFARGSKGRFGFFRMDDKALTTDQAIIAATVEVKKP